MRLFTPLAALTAALLFADGAVRAQVTFEPNLGTQFMPGDDAMVGPLTLGFNFTMPGGQVVTDVDADTNGRVVETGADTSDFSESVAELLAEAPSLCIFWDDLTPAGGVWFNALPGRAVITWPDSTLFNGNQQFTLQMQLYPDGRFTFYYDSRVPADEPLVGASAGNGAMDPGGSDLTGNVMTAGVPDVYEDFPAGGFDLIGGGLEFVPDGNGGYDVTWFPIPFASVEEGRSASDFEFALTFTPNGNGGYDSALGGSFDETYVNGTQLSLGDDTLSGPLQMAHMFTMPDGNATMDIELDSNGRIIVPGTGETSDFSATVGEMLGDPTPIVAPFWLDLSPNVSGTVTFDTTATSTSITFVDVPQFNTPNALTFQARLFADGSIQFVYRGVAAEFVSTGGSGDNPMVGVSAGNGVADPGEVDLNSGPLSSGAAPVHYEWFDVTGAGDVVDLVDVVPPSLDFQGLPVVGGPSFTINIVDQAPSATGEIYLVGLPATIDLDRLGFTGYTLLTLGEAINFATTAGGGYTAALPNDPVLTGTVVEIQGISVDMMANPGGAALTDSLVATLGL